MAMIKKILLALLVVLIIIQFFKPEKNISEGPFTNDISTLYPVPDNVKLILDKACNDCHTNTTKYPWYANFQPVAWFLAEHVEDGKKHFNLSEFAAYNPDWVKWHKLEELVEMVEENEMPLKSYTLIHRDAALSEEEKVALISWAQDIRAQMEADSTIDLTPPKRPAR